MVTNEYFAARIEQMERDLAELRRQMRASRRKAAKSPRGALKGLVVDLDDVKRAAREIFEPERKW
jgi:hypothetical protein